ncbi:MAG: hypothetical protein MJB57_15080 [Gemmatimonadetes bacterium]|nr:hypothetical protein [Gemmatimonadota bacterium]
MQKSRLAISFLAVTPFLTACGNTTTVQVLMDGAEAPQPVSDHEVQFLPFDRDSLFQAIAAQSSTPEPQVPADLRAAADSVQVLQAAWRDAEASWNEVRDSLRGISDQLQSLDARSREYRELFDGFGAMEGRERSLNNRRQNTFDAFTALQQTTQERLDSVRAVIESWEDVAFADYNDIETDLLEGLGRQIVYDTTDATGYVTQTLSGGPWWIHSRVRVPSGELYWNLMTDGAADTLRLEPGNAERRLAF